MYEKPYIMYNLEYNTLVCEQIYVAVTVHTSICQMLGSNLGQYTRYPEFIGVFLSLVRQIIIIICWVLASFSDSSSYTQSVGHLGRGISP
jgi:hypothetical protein